MSVKNMFMETCRLAFYRQSHKTSVFNKHIFFVKKIKYFNQHFSYSAV